MMDDDDTSWLFTGSFVSDPDVDLSSPTNSKMWIPFIFIGLAALAIIAAIFTLLYDLIHK